MKRTTLFWLAAFFLTVVSAYYQRVTGPTYPLSGSVDLGGKNIPYRLERSHGGTTNAAVELATGDSSIHGIVEWKRFKTNDEWQPLVMAFSDGKLRSELPHQPPAGKLLYRIIISQKDDHAFVPSGDPVVIRFKGDVPLTILIPHILIMFAAMLLSLRTGLECFGREPKFRKLILWTISLLFAGGLILGPMVQLYAFDAWWTGWPFGTDLTDNKTAAALLAWVIALVALRKSKHPRAWVLGAAIVTMIVYLVPHSMFGSELDYGAAEKQKIENKRP